MTQDEIIEITKQAGGFSPTPEFLEAFAKLVDAKATAKEREACIVDIQMHIPRSGRDTLEYKMAMRMIERIKARGEA